MSLVLSLIFVGSNTALGSTHTHTEACFPYWTHTHSGVKTTRGGCYQGAVSYEYVACENPELEGVDGGSGGPCGSCGTGGYSYTVYKCKNCTYQTSRSYGGCSCGNYNSGPSSSLPTSHSYQVRVYALSCGYTEGDSPATIHIHSGTGTSAGGCYIAETETCGGTISSGSYSNGSFNGNGEAYECPICGGNLNSGGGWSCNKCGAGGSGGGHQCNGSTVDQDGNIYDSEGNLTGSTGSSGGYGGTCSAQIPTGRYITNCGYENNTWYYPNKTKATAICEKIVAYIRQRQ